MSATARPEPAAGPDLPTGEIVLPTPPRLQDAAGGGDLLTSVVPMLGGLGSVAVVATMTGATSGGQPRVLVTAGMFVVVTFGLVVTQVERQRTRRLRTVGAARSAYLRHLGTVRAVIRDAAAQQRAALLWRFPDPSALPSLAAERSRVWEREVADADFLQVRYGTCSRPLSCPLVTPDDPTGQADPVAWSALHRLVAVHETQPDLPATLDLRLVHRIEVRGPAERTRALARSVICSAATFHSPDDLAVAVLASEGSLAWWDWVKWLPHARSTQEADAVGPRRMVSTDLAELVRFLPRGGADRVPSGPDESSSPSTVLVVVDGGVPPPEGLPGVLVLDLTGRRDEPSEASTLRLRFEDGLRVSTRRHREPAATTVADQCDLATAEALARRLAPLGRVVPGSATARSSTGADDLLALLGVGDVRRLDPALSWRRRPGHDRLCVPLGLGDAGDPVRLDLEEAAQHGMGPHGLVVGATGSGKSELLRTVVLGLALTHSPEQLSLVLVDFKGGATFAGMSRLPHVSALITNLADDLTLVDRMQDALSGELLRRQEVLRDAGGYASVRDHERARRSGADLAPLPPLLVVVDEFSELLSARPEFVDLFVAIGRLGRSLGLHLLLASQRLEEGRLRGLESHLSYRICLRTFSAQESRAVLGVPDAHELPSTPGLGYLRTDPSTLVRFQAARVSEPPAGRPRHAREDRDASPEILPWTTSEVRPTERRASPEPRRAGVGHQESVLAIAVGRMVGHGPPARRIWLPPLDVPDTLDALMPDLAPDPQMGLVSHRWRSTGRLTLPLGTVDRPREQRRDALTVDLAGAGGHVAVVGGPRSGKSTLLRTLVTSLALTSTPAEAQVFVLDLGGGTFGALRSLPHVAGVAVRTEPDVVRRMVAEVTGIVDRREAGFRAQGIDSVDTYRSRRARGRLDDGYGDVFLVVDGWSALRAGFDDVEHEVQVLASRGLAFGFHLVTATARWADYRAAVRDLFGTRLELKLGDPLDSEIDRRLAAAVPAGRPGRGLLPGGLHFLAALPRIDGDPDDRSLGDGVGRMVVRVSDAWPGPPGPKLRLLPDRLGLRDLLERAGDELVAGPGLVLGLDERELAAVSLDPDAEPHWLVFGDGRSGKSAALRAYVHEVVRTRGPEQAQIVVVDYRRSLLGEVPEDYLLHYLTSGTQAAPALADLADRLTHRLPGLQVTPDQLRTRSWWTGPEVFVVVDDYDLVATPQSSPVQALLPLLAQAHDVGLRLVVARRSGGASRALYEPVIQALRDLAVPGLLLSGSPEEGVLLGGVRPVPAPAGRGRLVTRDRGVEVVQLGWREPSP